jgi:dATP pyrophosphohydrolase
MSGFKQPESVLVVIYSGDGQVLLLERADRPGFWQSVTGSREGDEVLIDTARRELWEETGLQAEPGQLSDWQQTNHYEIYPHWRHRYAPGVTHNQEHVFGFCLPEIQPVQLAPNEHLNWQWLPWEQAQALVFSPSNAEALRCVPARLAG